MIEAFGSTPGAGTSTREHGGAQLRGSPKAIQLLLPVWGTRYLGQFLYSSLPTLLAPHNLPSIAKLLPCKFSFLTSSEGANILREHPAIVYLRSICDVEIKNIDDLITGDNYSTTITLAYTRAVQEAGAAMLDTCFFFLISDYIMADGSLANVMKRMRAGISAVVAGNFQVVEEEAREPFFSRFDTGEPEIVLQSRDLVQWAMRYLHPMTIANMVNFPLCHSVHSNRLFWRVDENTLIGRFYLMHMICIRPETADFKIGSSCDYSFVPEMCPSGNVHVLIDSDEYLVVEMQPRRHEQGFLRLGAVYQNQLIGALAEWTTAVHRQNAHSAVVYHASDVPADIGSAIAESGEYIEAIEKRLPAPQPYRDHPYWIGAVAAHRWAVSQRKGAPIPESTRRISILFRFRDFVFGRPPHVRPWHPRWPDYQTTVQLARRYFQDRKGQLLIISSTPKTFQNWLSEVSASVVSVDLSQFLNLDSDQCERMVGEFEGCLLVVRETETPHVSELIAKLKHVLSRNNTLLIFALNGHGVAVGKRFSSDLLREISGFFDPDMALDEVKFIPAGWVTWVALRGMRLAFASATRSWVWLPLAVLAGAFFFTITTIGNLGRRGMMRPPRRQLCSSVSLALRKTSLDLPNAEIEKEIVAPLELAARRFSKAGAPLASAIGAEP